MSIASKSFGRTMLALMAIGFLALLAVAGTSLWLVARSREHSDLVTHTQDVVTQIYRVMTFAQEAETGQRGFLLTSNADYLDRHRAGMEALPGALAAARELTRDNPAQQGNMLELSQALQTKLDELKATIELAQSGRRDEALAMVQTNQGREAMRRVRAVVAAMLAEETGLLRGRTDELDANGVWLLVVDCAGVLLIAVVAAGSVFLIRRYLAELRAAQTALAGVNAGLEETVAERTADLTRANEEVQRFAYIVSHDLRAPLVNIMGFTSELDAARTAVVRQLDRIEREAPQLVEAEAKTAATEDLPEAIRFIRSSTTKMDRLINAILQLSRDGRRVLTPERVDMAKLVDGIAQTLHQQTTEIGAEILIKGKVPDLITDRLAVEQIFANLIENAVKYLDAERPGRIAVSGRMNGAMVRYDIEDNGRGIDEWDHERVFELFRRAGTQDKPGEGLGLSFVRSSVRRLGGTITLASQPGRGSTFSLEFPKFLLRGKRDQSA